MPIGDVSTFGEWALTYMEVRTSSVDGPHNAILYGAVTPVGSFSDDPEEDGETAQDEEGYGAPGLLFRPRPPEEVSTDAGERRLSAEAMGVRRGDGVVALAWRDLRFNRVFPSGPSAGSVALVGYGGGFIAFNDTDADSGDQKATVCVLYCPREFTGGIHAKAHSIILDPVQNTVSMLHGDGMGIVMDPDNGLTLRADANTYLNLQPGKFTVVANSQNLRGNVALGRDTLTAAPLMAGMASQATPSVYFSLI